MPIGHPHFNVHYVGIHAALVLLLGACASPSPRDDTSPPVKSGTVVVSVGATGKPFCDSISVLYRSLSPTDLPTAEELAERARKTSRPPPKRLNSFAYVPQNLFGGSRRDFDSPSSNGTVIARELPAGPYELVNYQCFVNGWPATTTFRAHEDFAVPFTVKDGEVTYLGEFLAVRMLAKNVLGFWNTAFVYLVATDKAERDLPLAARSLPQVSSQAISKQLITEATMQPGFVVLKPMPQPEGAPRVD